MRHPARGRILRRVAAAALLVLPAAAHDPVSTPLTWSREISRLVYHHCASCHRPGGPAMSLQTYADARPWAVAIAEEVAARRMPPWDAVKGFGQFQNDPSLSQDEIEQFLDWAAGGAPEGDPAWLPLPPKLTFSAGAPAAGRAFRFSGSIRLRAGATLAALRPVRLAAGASVQVLAVRPDGSVTPLLWVHEYRPGFSHAYTLLDPLALPKGTRLQTIPAGGTFELTLGIR